MSSHNSPLLCPLASPGGSGDRSSSIEHAYPLEVVNEGRRLLYGRSRSFGDSQDLGDAGETEQCNALEGGLWPSAAPENGLLLPWEEGFSELEEPDEDPAPPASPQLRGLARQAPAAAPVSLRASPGRRASCVGGDGPLAWQTAAGKLAKPSTTTVGNIPCVHDSAARGRAGVSATRRVVPTAINLKLLHKLRGQVGGATQSPGGTLDNSATSLASTSIPQSPLGVDSHFGSDTIQSSNSHYSACGAPALALRPQVSPLVIGSAAAVNRETSWKSLDLYNAQSPNSSSSVPQTSKSAGSSQSNRARRASHVGTGNRMFRTIETATSNSKQQLSEVPPWEDLAPLEVELNTQWWIRTTSGLDPASEDWEKQCISMNLMRRVALFHSTCFLELAPATVRRTINGTIGTAVVSRIVQLAESLRSVVARYAMTTLHNIFLFCSDKIDSQLCGESLQLCLRKSVGAGGGFLTEEANKTWTQVMMVAEPARTATTLGNLLTKQSRHNAALRHRCIFATGLFVLRLNASGLRLVCSHRDFSSQVLKPILKAISDANSECRTAAARSLVVLLNLIPDLLQRHRQALLDIDIFQLMSRIKRTAAFDVKAYFGVNALIDSLQNLPEEALVEDTIDNLTTVMSNIDLILKHPMPLTGTRPTSGGHGRSLTRAGTITRRDREYGDQDMTVRPLRPAMETVCGVEGFTRSGISPQAESAFRLSHPNTATSPLTPLRERGLVSQSLRSSTARDHNGFSFGCRQDQDVKDQQLIKTIEDDDAYEEDKPWSANPISETAVTPMKVTIGSRQIPTRNLLHSRTPARTRNERLFNTLECGGREITPSRLGPSNTRSSILSQESPIVFRNEHQRRSMRPLQDTGGGTVPRRLC